MIGPVPLEARDGVALTFDWRYVPGDGADRAAAQLDDSHWMHTPPESPRGWNGSGWFRRHIVIDRSLEGQPVAITIAAPGVADLSVDGALVSSIGHSPSPYFGGRRSDTETVTFRGGPHVLAVHYVFPAERAKGTFGFHVTLSLPAPAEAPASRDRVVALHGALIAVPIFLAFLHFALFAFDRRARENLFYAAEMLTFAAVIFHEYRTEFLATDAAQNMANYLSSGMPVLAAFLGMLTYYIVRMNRLPRSWRVFAAIGTVLFVWSYAVADAANYTWIILFAVVLVEIVRVERSGAIVQRGGTAFFLISFVAFCVSVVLQIFVNFGEIESIGGVREVYVFGVVIFAAGMSLYLAYNLGRSRLIEIENERKSGELARARRLQLSMLPKELPRVDGVDVAAMTLTAAEVGGDYYDVRVDAGGALLIAFGDATGHGLASGLIVTAAKTLFMSIASDAPLARTLCDFDRALREMRLPGFLRMCLALARVSPREAAVASAAMPPLMVHRATSGAVEELGRGDVPLGGRLRASYQERRTELAPGDTLLFASDGFAEQSGKDGRQLGYDGAAEAFRRAAGEPDAQRVLDSLAAIAQEFRGSVPQEDDITLLVVRLPSSPM